MLPMERMTSSPRPGLSSASSALALLLALSCAPAGQSSASSEESAPAGPFAVAEPETDFGEVYEGRILEHEWELRTRRPVRVEEAKTDCGCTLASLERGGASGREPYAFGSPLGAGDVLFLTVRYDTRGRRGPSQRSVTLRTEEGPAAPLVLRADVRSWLVVEPESIPFQRVLEGQGAECAVRVRAANGDAFRLEPSRRALPPWVEIELTPEAPGDDGRARAWSARARVGAEAPRGTYSYPLELVSDVELPGAGPGGDAVSPRHVSTAPAWGIQVLGPVALSTPSLEFGLVRPDETVAKSVILESFDPSYAPGSATAHLEPLKEGEPFPLARTARVRTRSAGQACEIELVLGGLDPEVQGTFLGKLVVETGHPGLPRLDALVRGVRAPSEAR